MRMILEDVFKSRTSCMIAARNVNFVCFQIVFKEYNVDKRV